MRDPMKARHWDWTERAWDWTMLVLAMLIIAAQAVGCAVRVPIEDNEGPSIRPAEVEPGGGGVHAPDVDPGPGLPTLDPSSFVVVSTGCPATCAPTCGPVVQAFRAQEVLCLTDYSWTDIEARERFYLRWCAENGTAPLGCFRTYRAREYVTLPTGEIVREERMAHYVAPFRAWDAPAGAIVTVTLETCDERATPPCNPVTASATLLNWPGLEQMGDRAAGPVHDVEHRVEERRRHQLEPRADAHLRVHPRSGAR